MGGCRRLKTIFLVKLHNYWAWITLQYKVVIDFVYWIDRVDYLALSLF